MTANLSRLLSEVQAPVFVVDERRMIVYVNAALESWLDIDGETLVGRRTDYTTSSGDDRAAAITAALCPPPSVSEGECVTATISFPSADGNSKRSVRYVPLGDELDCEGAIGIVGSDDLDAAKLRQSSGSAIAESTELHRQLQEFRQTAAGRYRLDRLIGKSAAMLRVQRQALLAIETKSRAVLIGPPGSGREHVARTIHFAGDDARAPTLMPLACPLLDAELFQSSITAFAHHAAENAATNTTTRPPTVLLCDVDQLSEGGQAELAGFLSFPGFELHMLATSRTSLLELAQRGEFRPSLAYALSTLEIVLPPLSARRQDIPLLAQAFVEELNAVGGKQLAGFVADAMDVLSEHNWEENADELREAVLSAAKSATGSTITLDALPRELVNSAAAPAASSKQDEPIDLDEVLADVEAELIRRAMRIAKGNKTKAAELLNISRPRLHRRWEEMEGSA